MKLTQYADGGRPFYDDDIQTIQDEAQAAAAALYAGLGRDCIVSGCAVGGTAGNYTLGPGFVYVGGALLRFLGASGVALPAGLVAGPVNVVDERTYQTGDTKACIQEVSAVLGPAGSGVPVYPTGGLTLQHVLRAAQWEPGDVKWGQLVAANYDPTGLGLPGTAAWGWGLCNGQGGRAALRGAFVAGFDPDRADYGAVGRTGGEEKHTLTALEMPSHAHAAGLKITDSKGDGEAAFNAALVSSPGASGQAIATEAAGGGQAHENRPPYYVLAARQWVGF